MAAAVVVVVAAAAAALDQTLAALTVLCLWLLKGLWLLL